MNDRNGRATQMTILITGANRGIGKALLDTYAARGDSVLGTSRTTTGGESWLSLDVMQPTSLQALGKELRGKPVATLICNAGVYHDKGESLEDGYAPQQWADTFGANVTGVFLSIQTLLPNLRLVSKTGQAKVAIISSKMATSSNAPGGAYIYRASKAAAVNLGRNLAVDLKPENIAVGIYHPGWVRTDMGSQAADISTKESAVGLVERIDKLSMTTSGCFEAYDGEEMAL